MSLLIFKLEVHETEPRKWVNLKPDSMKKVLRSKPEDFKKRKIGTTYDNMCIRHNPVKDILYWKNLRNLPCKSQRSNNLVTH
jgi:hypothetical protein